MIIIKIKIMKKIVSVFLLAIIFACSSSNREIYIKYKDLSEGGQWNASDEIFFKVNVEDVAATYELKFFFRCLEGFQYKNMNIKVTQISPSKIEEVKEYSLKVFGEEGEILGEELGSIYDSETVVETSKKFDESGVYIFKVESNMSVNVIKNALELGLAVTKSE